MSSRYRPCTSGPRANRSLYYHLTPAGRAYLAASDAQVIVTQLRQQIDAERRARPVPVFDAVLCNTRGKVIGLGTSKPTPQPPASIRDVIADGSPAVCVFPFVVLAGNPRTPVAAFERVSHATAWACAHYSAGGCEIVDHTSIRADVAFPGK